MQNATHYDPYADRNTRRKAITFNNDLSVLPVYEAIDSERNTRVMNFDSKNTVTKKQVMAWYTKHFHRKLKPQIYEKMQVELQGALDTLDEPITCSNLQSLAARKDRSGSTLKDAEGNVDNTLRAWHLITGRMLGHAALHFGDIVGSSANYEAPLKAMVPAAVSAKAISSAPAPATVVEPPPLAALTTQAAHPSHEKPAETKKPEAALPNQAPEKMSPATAPVIASAKEVAVAAVGMTPIEVDTNAGWVKKSTLITKLQPDYKRLNPVWDVLCALAHKQLNDHPADGAIAVFKYRDHPMRMQYHIYRGSATWRAGEESAETIVAWARQNAKDPFIHEAEKPTAPQPEQQVQAAATEAVTELLVPAATQPSFTAPLPATIKAYPNHWPDEAELPFTHAEQPVPMDTGKRTVPARSWCERIEAQAPSASNGIIVEEDIDQIRSAYRECFDELKSACNGTVNWKKSFGSGNGLALDETVFQARLDGAIASSNNPELVKSLQSQFDRVRALHAAHDKAYAKMQAQGI